MRYDHYIPLRPQAIAEAVASLEAEGFEVSTAPVDLLAHGVVLVAYRPSDGEGYLISAPEASLVALYGLAVLDPHRGEDTRPRWQRETTRRREEAYVEAALARAIAEVSTAPSGARNNTLSRVSYSLGRLEHLGLDRNRVLEELEAAATQAGLPLAEARETAKRGFDKGTQNPRDLPPNQPFSANRLAENQTRWLSQKSDFTPRLTTQWESPRKGGW